jgi:lipopolysaccharide biosynthesis regulator YciM
VPPFDREAALKSAEKAIKQGRVDAAIAEYTKVVEAQPRDWNTANALGDLYVRSNQVEKGVQQYTRIADHLAGEGFYPKAAALYKKILKIRPDDEYAIFQSGDLAAKQNKLVDAKQFFTQLAERRKTRGDKKGAAEIAIRLGTLDPEDYEARLRAAQLAADMGDAATALREYKDVAARLEKKDRYVEALAPLEAAYALDKSDDNIRARLFLAHLGKDPLAARAFAKGSDDLKQLAAALERAGQNDAALGVMAEIAAADPENIEYRASLAQAYVSQGQIDKAKAFLSPEIAGTNPELWLMLAEMELRENRLPEGKAAVLEALRLDASRAQSAVILGCSLAADNPEAGYQPVDAVADFALAANDFGAAAVALREFTARVPAHLVALMRLVEVCVDGALEAEMYEAQAQLAEAYLDSGRALEARIISEDLVAREPWNKANIERFRRALVMLGEADPDAIIADRLSGESPFLATEKLDLNEGENFDAPSPAAVDTVEVTAAAEPSGAGRSPADDSAAEQYRLALTYHEMGMVDDAIKALEMAAKSPRHRFDAASMLGRLCIERKDHAGAIQWLDRASEAPSPSAAASHALLYDLGFALDRAGEQARALAVFVELEAESGGYRDVSDHIERLSKAQARG